MTEEERNDEIEKERNDEIWRRVKIFARVSLLVGAAIGLGGGFWLGRIVTVMGTT